MTTNYIRWPSQPTYPHIWLKVTLPLSKKPCLILPCPELKTAWGGQQSFRNLGEISTTHFQALFSLPEGWSKILRFHILVSLLLSLLGASREDVMTDLANCFAISDCKKCKSSIRARNVTWFQRYKLYSNKAIECVCSTTMSLEPSLFMRYYEANKTKDLKKAKGAKVITLDWFLNVSDKLADCIYIFNQIVNISLLHVTHLWIRFVIIYLNNDLMLTCSKLE